MLQIPANDEPVEGPLLGRGPAPGLSATAVPFVRHLLPVLLLATHGNRAHCLQAGFGSPGLPLPATGGHGHHYQYANGASPFAVTGGMSMASAPVSLPVITCSNTQLSPSEFAGPGGTPCPRFRASGHWRGLLHVRTLRSWRSRTPRPNAFALQSLGCSSGLPRCT